jgi:type I restriction enzyme S subunit
MSWEETSLDDCIEFSNGYAFKSKFFTENKNDIPLIKGENLGKGEVLWEKSKYWKVESLKGLERFLLNVGDIILAMDRPYVGGSLKYAMIKTSDPKALQVQRIGRLVAKQSVINKKFLRCVISSDNFKNYVKNIQGGVGVPHISPSQIKNYEFNLPPLQTQQRIADILSAYDDLIENNLKRIKLLEQAAQNIYKEWFVNLRFPGYENTTINKETGLPKGWEEKKIIDCELKIGDGNYSSKYPKAKDFLKKGIPFFSTKEMVNGRLSLKDVKRISNHQHSKLTKGHLKGGDVLLSTRGSIGKVAYIDDRFEGYNINAQLVLFRCDNMKMYNKFLYCQLSTPIMYKKIINVGSGSAQPQLPIKTLNQFKILVPNSDVQKEFNSLVSNKFKLLEVLLIQNQKLKAARDILLPRLMNRTIEV